MERIESPEGKGRQGKSRGITIQRQGENNTKQVGSRVVTSSMASIQNRFSELVLAAMVILLVSLVRIYYGGSQGIMVVWKGEPSFKDTVVNLSELMRLPAEELRTNHPSVHWQLVAMDLLEETAELDNVRQRHLYHRSPTNSGELPAVNDATPPRRN